ncbi:SDR family NAD(P)-dependent oxidoreductase [Rhodococcus erythropolis]|uniref:SDR family NAD(P)-dependent oxidoreductase n=1 Tax=Rhodococcus erythropolis TaxID=1833 RepID=UPI000878CE02|nr:SDR family NAD(P)-dependent oxidoreductase [Rhodococcus erythropolis]OFV78624.1 2-(R)-hydroxypropyl-CoM dehydrogenase [Rhodococcus erythropolis]
MDLGLNTRVALITGGASGIGRAVADALAREGARVVIADRDAAGQSVAHNLRAAGRDAVFVRTDVTDETDVASAVQHTLDTYGSLDTVCGCAGISGPVGRKVDDIDAADWDLVQSVNVRGNFLLAKHTVAALSDSDIGTLVFVASDSAFVAFEGMTPYSVSKAALVMLAKSLSVDHPHMRVNAVCPGIVDTPMSRADLDAAGGFDTAEFPVVSAEQIAHHVLFLASPISEPTNGTSPIVDFGMHCRAAIGTLDF